ncbi:hypothetical protein [Acidihalobacter aeolianus]|uniref:hypothetical protein n=1 Tax=Acidihalobacter aeolianus TaxID=2792603 RepID=UPI0012EAAD83|nr:hypothetical protein [Acidihalobacter aeolianus]
MTADFGKRAEIGHDQTKWPVTLIRNGRSRSSEMTGHVAPKYAAKQTSSQNKKTININKFSLNTGIHIGHAPIFRRHAL